MLKIQTLNKIASCGLELFSREKYEIASEIVNPDAIIVRSQSMHDMELPASVKAVARAGAGVNNIPVDTLSDKGVVVFNTPGANANGVKELTLAGLFLASRKVFRGIAWAKSLTGKGDEVPAIIEKNKSTYAGCEIKGKRLGVIGLGAIGVAVANDAESLGMKVSGYDPFISIEAAWGLSRTIAKAPSLDALIADSDYISIHVPLNDKTRGLLNSDKFAIMKKGVKILNFSRGGLVKNADLLQAIDQGIVDRYVTDFPDESLLSVENVLPIPHLGASTPESEDNCAIMAARQIMDFLETGNIRNSVNFPDCALQLTGNDRLLIANKNVPNMLGQFTTILADAKMNIADMINKHQGDFAYNIIDVEGSLDDTVLESIRKISGVIMVRRISQG